MKKLLIVFGLLLGTTGVGHAMSNFHTLVQEGKWAEVAKELNRQIVPAKLEAAIEELLKSSRDDLSKQVNGTHLLEELLTASKQKGESDNPGSRVALKALLAQRKINIALSACSSNNYSELRQILNELRKETWFGFLRYPVIIRDETNDSTSILPGYRVTLQDHKFWMSATAIAVIAAGIYWFTKKSDAQDEDDEQEDTPEKETTTTEQVAAQ